MRLQCGAMRSTRRHEVPCGAVRSHAVHAAPCGAMRRSAEPCGAMRRHAVHAAPCGVTRRHAVVQECPRRPPVRTRGRIFRAGSGICGPTPSALLTDADVSTLRGAGYTPAAQLRRSGSGLQCTRPPRGSDFASVPPRGSDFASVPPRGRDLASVPPRGRDSLRYPVQQPGRERHCRAGAATWPACRAVGSRAPRRGARRRWRRSPRPRATRPRGPPARLPARVVRIPR
jgi:hypothetical protein